MKTIRVLIVDDSALMRKLLTDLLNSDREIEVVGTAIDAYAARDKIKKLEPDVVTLDVEMPKMDGVTFLSNLMRLHPLPVVMVSTLTTKGADLTLRALELGAVDFVAKPVVDLAHTLDDYALEITNKVKFAATAKVGALHSYDGDSDNASASNGKAAVKVQSQGSVGASYRTTDQVIAIGASTGGTEAIKEVLVRMPPDGPGIAIAQHIPPVFSRSFAERMNQVSPLAVCEATDGQLILPGHAYVAPGDQHLEVIRDGAKYRCKLNNGEPVNRHKPSVDVLFDSVANNVGRNAVGAILTGMGKDGALGLKRMHDAGAQTVAQDENSSVIWGMPKAAIDVGGADAVLPLKSIARKLTELTSL